MTSTRATTRCAIMQLQWPCDSISGSCWAAAFSVVPLAAVDCNPEPGLLQHLQLPCLATLTALAVSCVHATQSPVSLVAQTASIMTSTISHIWYLAQCEAAACKLRSCHGPAVHKPPQQSCGTQCCLNLGPECPPATIMVLANLAHIGHRVTANTVGWRWYHAPACNQLECGCGL